MSTAADSPDPPGGKPMEPPEFELEYLLDDADEPTELTVYAPGGGDPTTHWITVNFEAAIPLHAVR